MSDLVKLVQDQTTRMEAIISLLEIHRCNSDGRRSVANCVASGDCRCSCELFVDPTSSRRVPVIAGAVEGQ